MTRIEHTKALKGWPWTEQVNTLVYATNQNWPKISVVTPSFNQGSFIEETILSVIHQNYPNLEYIIIDGGSSDQTVSIIQKYEKHISYWVSEPDSGQTHALNKGISKASGDILFWINSDDYLEPEAFYKVALAFINEPSLQVVCGRLHIIGGSKTYITYTEITPDVMERVITMNRFQQPPTIFKLGFVKSIGLLDEQYHFIMDLELWMQYLSQYGTSHIKEIPDVIANFRLHDVSKSVSQSLMFERERDGLYFGLIREDNPSLYEKLSELLPLEALSIDRLKSKILKYNLMKVNVIAQYYMLLRTMELYEQGDRRKARKLASFIQVELLQLKDQSLLKKLRWKIFFVPYALKKAIQKIRK